MQANTLTPTGLFGAPARYVVPLFQRPYVWNEDDQWQPLWDDVRTLTDELLESGTDPYGAAVAVPPHFLGAIVLDQQRLPAGFIGVRHVIDGQQRLTTLQLLLDAAQRVVDAHGHTIDAQALRVLVRNDESITQDPDQVFKVWPTDRDQDAFRATMGGATTAQGRIGDAHTFFATRIREWAGADDTSVKHRLGTLVRALRDHLKLVVIDLEAGDNAQVIFETLNHRGSRLLAADLVKNFVFQIAENQQSDVADLHARYWRDLDDDAWRTPIAQGRFYRPRIDVFLNHWLTITLLREVPADRVFLEFRDHVQRTRPAVSELLATVASDAAVYARLDRLPRSSLEGRFHYRVVQAMGAGVVQPFLLWVMRWPEDRMPAEERGRALRAVESWVVRRVLCRATVKDLNRLVVDLLRAVVTAGPENAGKAVEDLLDGQRADSRSWPTNDHVRVALVDAHVYKSLTRPRLRMVLEALEDRLRGPLGEGEPCPRNLSIEHVMPQAWRQHWGDDVDDADVRDTLIHALGNLTLVSGRLNPTLSNRPWHGGGALPGKRAYLLDHSSLLLNAGLVAQHDAAWTEQDVRRRTETMIDGILAEWPRPATRSDPSLDREGTPEAIEHAGKYRVLHEWLLQQSEDELPMGFGAVEEVLGIALPGSARAHTAHWYGYDGTALGRSIRDAGWRATEVDLDAERVVLVRVP